MMTLAMTWLAESNRYKHLLYAIPVGLLFTILCVVGLASGMEFKDRLYGNRWDWTDWWCTIAGGMVGQAIQIILLWLIL